MPVQIINQPMQKAHSSDTINFASPDRQTWLKREFGVFMKSVQLLHQGLDQIKTCQSLDIAQDITSETYMKIITTLLESVGEERSRDLKEKIMGSIVEDSAVSEFSGSLLGKRRRFDSQFKTITERFNLGKSPGPNSRVFDFDKSPSLNSQHQTPNMAETGPFDKMQKLTWKNLRMVKRDSTPLMNKKEQACKPLSSLMNENRTLKKPDTLKVIPWLKPVNLRKISISILLNNSDYDGPQLTQDQNIITRDGVDGVDLNLIVKYAMERYKISADLGVQVDYWSNMS